MCSPRLAWGKETLRSGPGQIWAITTTEPHIFGRVDRFGRRTEEAKVTTELELLRVEVADRARLLGIGIVHLREDAPQSGIAPPPASGSFRRMINRVLC